MIKTTPTFLYPLVIGILAACNSTEPAPSTPPEMETQSATLPPNVASEGLCPDEADRDAFFQPSLSAYAALADSIFVGTIAEVSLKSLPPLHITDHPTEGRVEVGTIDVEDCPSDVAFIKVISLVDVETLHGQDVGDTLEIPVTYGMLEHEFGVYFDRESRVVATLDGEEYFRPGTTIGGLIRTQGYPAPYLSGFEHTMFEVYDEVVHLRHPTLACLDKFDPFGIPDEFDGQPLSALREALGDLQPLTPDEQTALSEAQASVAWQPNRFDNICVEKIGDWPTGPSTGPSGDQGD